MKTPKEKAEELVKKFYEVETTDYELGIDRVMAKECAIIACDEILNNFGLLANGKHHYATYSTIVFYTKVKQEIPNVNIKP